MAPRTPLPSPLPAGAVARPGSLDDVDEVVALLHAVEHLELGAPLTTRGEMIGDWQRPSMDVGRDVVVVESAGRVVGYAEQLQGRAFADVHPDHRGRGIGSALAAWTEVRARAEGAPRVGQPIPRAATASLALLEGRGYTPRWESWILRIGLDADLGTPRPPDGVTIRSLRRPDDDRDVHELVETAFGDWPDRDAGTSFEDWRASHLDRDEVEVSLVLLATAGSDLLGAALCVVEDDEGWVEQLAVARAHRGRGIAGALLREAFARFRERGLATGALSTDSRTGARDLYEHVGMAVTDTFVHMSVVLSPAPPGDAGSGRVTNAAPAP